MFLNTDSCPWGWGRKLHLFENQSSIGYNPRFPAWMQGPLWSDPGCLSNLIWPHVAPFGCPQRACYIPQTRTSQLLCLPCSSHPPLCEPHWLTQPSDFTLRKPFFALGPDWGLILHTPAAPSASISLFDMQGGICPLAFLSSIRESRMAENVFFTSASSARWFAPRRHP